MPSWRDLRRFCENDGWELYKSTGDYYYRKEDIDGNIKRVKVSKGTGEIYGHLWQEILKMRIATITEHTNATTALMIILSFFPFRRLLIYQICQDHTRVHAHTVCYRLYRAHALLLLHLIPGEVV